MDESLEVDFPIDTGTVCYLSSEGQVSEIVDELIKQCDDRNGIQARLSLTNVTTDDAFDNILRTAKAGSRWGKDLSVVYRDAVTGYLEGLNDDAAIDELSNWYDELGSDAYKSELTGEPMSIGFDVIDGVREQLNSWPTLDFNEADLTAAKTVARRQGLVSEGNDCVLIESETPLSTLHDRNDIGKLVQVLTKLQLNNFVVFLVLPKGKANEETVLRETLRELGTFELHDLTDSGIEITEEVEEFVDAWYDRLCYEVSGGQVPERVIQSAIVTKYDLPDDEKARHFIQAIEDGLQVRYSEQKFSKEQFDKIRQGRITSHPNYDKNRSRYTDFPTVKIARTDGITREFRLSHEGLHAAPHLDGRRIDVREPERALVDLIERFLNAEPVRKERWDELVETAQKKLSRYAVADAERLVSEALLNRTHKVQDIPPLVSSHESWRESDDNDTELYDDYWKTILSGYEITAGTNIIAEKQKLMQSLDGTSVADDVLYHKLQIDIENAWEFYVDGLTSGIRGSVPDRYDLTITCEERSDGQRLIFTVSGLTLEQIKTVVDIHLPYSDVRVNGEPITKARISTVVSTVVSTFEEVLPEQTPMEAYGGREIAEEELLYEVIRFYINITECDVGDRVYFDDVLAFCRQLPGIGDRFDRSGDGTNDERLAPIDIPEVVKKLRDAGAKTHLKGSDDHGFVTDPQGQKITAFDVTSKLI